MKRGWIVLFILVMFVLSACQEIPADNGVSIDKYTGKIYYPVSWGKVIDSEVSHGGGGITVVATFENGKSVVVHLGTNVPETFVFEPR